MSQATITRGFHKFRVKPWRVHIPFYFPAAHPDDRGHARF